MPTAKPPKSGHTFTGEIRVSVDKSIIKNELTEIEVMELVQRTMEGEQVNGVKVEYFEVRGKERTTEEATDGTYSEVTPFMASAEKISEEVRPTKQRKKPANKKGKKKH